jgi:H+/Cl- antiporter ClcA
MGRDTPPWWLVVGLPVVGAALTWVARRLLPGDGGHRPLLGIGGEPTAWQHAPSIALAALGTLAFGIVLGPEGPLIALGSAVGMASVALLRLRDPVATKVLGTAGSFSAVSALFGGPIVAGMLLLEGGLAAGAALLPALLPGLVAAAIGYSIIVGVGDWGGVQEAALSVPGLPTYDQTSLRDLALAVVVGLVTAIAVAAVRKVAWRCEALAGRSMALTLLAGGLVIGLLGQLAVLLGADAPEVLFSGQAAVPQLITEGTTATIVMLVLVKAAAYAVSLGCGFRGGPVFPAIFLGVGVATLPIVWFDVSPTWAVAVGAAAGMTAGTRLVFSSLLLATLLVGTAGVDTIPCSVLGAVTAWLVMRALEPEAAAEATEAPAAPAAPSR